MTPEQEALYALSCDRPRSDVSVPAQLEYDRLKPVWQRSVPSEVMESNSGAGALLEHDARPGSRHTVDWSGTVHTFRPHRGGSLFVGISFAVTAVLVAAVGLSSVAAPSGLDIGSRVLLCGLVCIPCVWLGIRLTRMGVQVGHGELIIRNLRTYVVDVAAIREITLERKPVYQGTDPWLPRVHLTDGRRIWLEGWSCGPAGNPPRLELVATLDELCTLIGIDSPYGAFHPGRYRSGRRGTHRGSRR